jgi:hypothetical protein
LTALVKLPRTIIKHESLDKAFVSQDLQFPNVIPMVGFVNLDKTLAWIARLVTSPARENLTGRENSMIN